MSYLYDKQGEGDPDLKALEERLGSARYQKPAARRSRWPFAVGAALAAGLAALMLVPRGPSLEVSGASGTSRLAVGAWLETKERSVITVASIGQVTVEPSSRVRIVETSVKQQRLELEQGKLHAKVTAPPRLFVVDTPAVQAVDLGCEYELAVEPSGATRLEVTKGEVSLEGGSVSSRVSAGAWARTPKGRLPGVPRSLSASPEFNAAVDAFEGGGSLAPVLDAATATDAVSLWNLLARVEGWQRPKVLERLSGLIGRVPADDDAEVVKLEPRAMELLWQSFP